ncbi:TPA: hypothetical protein MIZ16_02795 [Klebsiella pneumoniae]|nr:hypothetical protein [Klebsiella pneumoniae]
MISTSGTIDDDCFVIAKHIPFRFTSLSIPRNIRAFWSLLATPADFASGKKKTVLEAAATPEMKNTPSGMIFNTLSNPMLIILLPLSLVGGISASGISSHTSIF